MIPEREQAIRKSVTECLEVSKDYRVLRPWAEVAKELLAEIDCLRESEASLQEAVRIYGGHAGMCDDKAPHACACGFRQVYIKATIKNERTENSSNAAEKPGGVRRNP